MYQSHIKFFFFGLLNKPIEKQVLEVKDDDDDALQVNQSHVIHDLKISDLQFLSASDRKKLILLLNYVIKTFYAMSTLNQTSKLVRRVYNRKWVMYITDKLCFFLYIPNN